MGVSVKRLLVALILLLGALPGACRPAPRALPISTPEEAGLSWQECPVGGLAQAAPCLDTQRPSKSEAERVRLGVRSSVGLRLTVGGDTYETRHLGLGVIPAWPWDPYVLLRNGRPVSLLFGEGETHDPEISLQEIADKAAWEFADARQATIIYGGRDLRRAYGLEAAYAPYELGGRLAFIGKQGGHCFLVYDGRQVGPAFDEITIAYCCETSLHSAGGGEGRYRFWGQRGDQSYVVEVAIAPLPRAFKGYELYSWREGDEWRFTLIEGTNRLKSCEEITGDADTGSAMPKVTVTGVEALKATLERLPKGERVFWPDEAWWRQTHQGAKANLVQPEQAVVDDIIRHCEQLGIELQRPWPGWRGTAVDGKMRRSTAPRTAGGAGSSSIASGWKAFGRQKGVEA